MLAAARVLDTQSFQCASVGRRQSASGRVASALEHVVEYQLIAVESGQGHTGSGLWPTGAAGESKRIVLIDTGEVGGTGHDTVADLSLKVTVTVPETPFGGLSRM